MKKFFLPLIAILALFLSVSCSSDDSPVIEPDPDPINNKLSGQITSDMTLTNDVIWELQGRVVVTSGATLTINEGTIIKAYAGQEASASVLIIARGAKIKANGTAAKPIIFTSIADNIALGQSNGTNLTQNDRGLWGGLIILGKAKASLAGDALENQIEGIPASDTNGLYGGNDNADDSGSLNYVSIRHGGTSIGDGNEINGLTLGAVGSTTIISNVEVVANVDDGIEWFGGAVNVSNAIVWACGDDGLDIDEAYSGTVTNSAVIQGDISDHALEIDGPAGSLEGRFTLDGITLIGNTTTENGEYADLRDRAMGTLKNIYTVGFKADSDVELDNNGVAQNFIDGKLTFSNWVVDLPSGVAEAKDIFVEKTGSGENPIILNPTFTERAASWATAGNSGGANLSAFSWTFAKSKGAF
ncbi:MAG TPA: hypothetical protein PLV43_02840 [Aequorivita sp.]|nr:hypothetical protein [Aequorivita sp.]HPE82629.1 hypothetical protein [Aequorivita sp.]